MSEWLDDNAKIFQELSGKFLNPHIIDSNLFRITPVKPVHDVSAKVMDEINRKIKELYDSHKRVIVLQTDDDLKDENLRKALIEVLTDHIDILKYNYITECVYDQDCAVCYKRLLFFISHLEKEVKALKTPKKEENYAQ